VQTLRVAAREVVVDVQVVDKKGQPVTGLKAADFKLIEERDPQAIRSFEEHRPKPAPVVQIPALPLNTFTNYTPPSNSGTPVVILLDAMDTDIDHQMERRTAVVKYLKQMPPGPPVAIFQFDKSMRLIQGFTTDRQVLLAAAQSLRDSPTLALPPEVEAARFADLDTLLRLKRKALEEGMMTLTRYLAAYPGRKSMVWFTGDLPMHKVNFGNPSFNHETTVSGPDSSEAAELTDVLTINRVAVYTVDSAGLDTIPISPSPGAGAMISNNRAASHANLDYVAAQTGGKAYYNTNDLTQAITDAVNADSNYYTLVYSTTNTNWSGEYRRIRVTVDRPDVTLRHKQGYYALNLGAAAQGKVSSDEKRREDAEEQASETAPGVAPAAYKGGFKAAMMLGATPATQILFVTHIDADAAAEKLGKGAPMPADNYMKPDWQHKPFHTYNITFNVDASKLNLTQAPDGKRHGKIQFAAVLFTQDQQQVNSIARTASFAVTPDQYRRLLDAGLPARMGFAIPAKGIFFLRLGVYDVNGDQIGAFELPVDQIKPETATAQSH
jgi:VWFA-related protein